jgi:cell shape-determining protein MreC
MKAEPAGRKHIGPMAQDFYAAFGLGDSDRYIALGDGQGVALAAIQALYQVVQERDGQVRKLRQQLQVIREMDGQLKKQLQELRHAQSLEITALEQRLTRLEAQGRMARTGPTTTGAQGKQRSSQPRGGI